VPLATVALVARLTFIARSSCGRYRSPTASAAARSATVVARASGSHTRLRYLV
jgi:hypothetical protein